MSNMKRLVCIAIPLIVLLVFPGFNRFDPREASVPTEEQLIAYVKEAASYISIYGRTAAIREFMKKGGLFHRGELYIFAYDYNCKVVAHGANPEWVGNDYSNLKDPVSGERIIRKMAAIAKSKKQGKITYKWFHPETRRVMTKIGYIMRVDDTWWIGSGFYVPE